MLECLINGIKRESGLTVQMHQHLHAKQDSQEKDYACEVLWLTKALLNVCVTVF